jgi:hypothetical protein
MSLTYDRIKDSFVRALESAGLVSLDPGRHKTLTDLVDQHTEAVRKFLTQEQPEVVAQAPKADPAASADDAAEWLPEIKLPEGWSFRQIPSTAHGAGASVFAHYDKATGTPVAGVAHVHLISPDKSIVDVRFKPDEGKAALVELVNHAVENFNKPESVPPPPSAPAGEVQVQVEVGSKEYEAVLDSGWTPTPAAKV